jgi:uncharacterized protein YodC (DUF2158 family)
MSTFSEGQIVELKSGGPQMTIQSIDGSDAVCIWSWKRISLSQL